LDDHAVAAEGIGTYLPKNEIPLCIDRLRTQIVQDPLELEAVEGPVSGWVCPVLGDETVID
jgi:hypothetical protein